MMSNTSNSTLNHVLEFTNDGWKHVTADILRERGVTHHISADSKQFLCALCNQYALLTKDGNNRSHFRHPSSTGNHCPEKLKGFGATYYDFHLDELLPIKIVVSGGSYHFEVGFPRLPEAVFEQAENNHEQIKLTNDKDYFRTYSISRERFSGDRTSYFTITSDLSRKINLVYSNPHSQVKYFWGTELSACVDSYLLFDGVTGKKIANGAMAKMNYTYYLLTCRDILPSISDIQIERLDRSIQYGTHKLYQIKATAFTIKSTAFFQKCGVRLRDGDVLFVPIWPVSIIREYNVIYPETQNRMVFYYSENSDDGRIKQNYPYAYSAKRVGSKPIYTIPVDGRQHIVALGRDAVLEYYYLSTENANVEIPHACVDITNNKDEKITNFTHAPSSGILNVSLPWDGVVDVFFNQTLVSRKQLSAGRLETLYNVRLGTEILIYCGLDCVRSVRFEPNLIAKANNIVPLMALRESKGRQVAIPHSLGHLATEWKNYPEVIAWIRSCIRVGFMSEGAYEKLINKKREE